MISALEHFAYCPRQAALIHVDGEWRDNARTISAKRFHRKADSGKVEARRGRQVLYSMPLWSERLGLSGRADAVEFDNTGVWPVEYKAGRRIGDTADVQLCAQAMCLEEMLDLDVTVGYLWLGASRRRVEVPLDAPLRTKVEIATASVRAAIESGQLPAAVNDERCDSCQLSPVCLPALCALEPAVLTRSIREALSA